MDREGTVCKYNEILLSCEKEWNTAICDSMDGLRDYHVESSKSDKENYHMIYSWYISESLSYTSETNTL